MQRLSDEDHRKLYQAMSELEPLATLVKQLEAKQQVSAQYGEACVCSDTQTTQQCELGSQRPHIPYGKAWGRATVLVPI